MITFWILYSYLVPISLFVSLEIVKFWQGFLYINHDREMKVKLNCGKAPACCTDTLSTVPVLTLTLDSRHVTVDALETSAVRTVGKCMSSQQTCAIHC